MADRMTEERYMPEREKPGSVSSDLCRADSASTRPTVNVHRATLKTRKKMEATIPRERWGWWIDVCPGKTLHLRDATPSDLARCVMREGDTRGPADFLCELPSDGALVSREAVEYLTTYAVGVVEAVSGPAQHNEHEPASTSAQQVEQSTTLETRTYSDGTIATGKAPLPNASPAQQDEYSTLIQRGESLLRAWHAKYGEHQPAWLPPAGDVRWMEDASAFLATAAAQSTTLEPEYWQWRRKGEPWSLEKTFNSQVYATTPDSEVRGLYATPEAAMALLREAREALAGVVVVLERAVTGKSGGLFSYIQCRDGSMREAAGPINRSNALIARIDALDGKKEQQP